MKQVLCNSNGAVIARMPRPTLAAGTVIVKTHYSLISVGTELAPLRSSSSDLSVTNIEKAKIYSSTARQYLWKALKNPDKAMLRASQIVSKAAENLRFRFVENCSAISEETSEIQWTQAGSGQLNISASHIDLSTDTTEYGYQMVSSPIPIEPGKVPVVYLKGTVHNGAISVGFLSEAKDKWLNSRIIGEGTFDDKLVCEPGDSKTTSLVVANAGELKKSHIIFDEIRVCMSSPTKDGLPLSELNDQGWNVGYSAAGEVFAVGPGVTDLSPGNQVACAGAGFANHAEYVCVPRNLLCKLPLNCSLKSAATTTVGTIALQGVRRADPKLGEKVCVIGLGLIGQITVQLLKASGCIVCGTDLDEARVKRAVQSGMTQGSSNVGNFKNIVRDLTNGYGADIAIITAATKSDAVINLAMEITRAKGKVVIVGDVGMKVNRQHFYRKEIDLLMSTSYGPGRYDRHYEIEGKDYPLAYVRWTLNRNMQAYVDLVSSGYINVESLIDKIVTINEVPAAYAELVSPEGSSYLGVLIHYPEETNESVSTSGQTNIQIRGHKKIIDGPAQYALVGAGAFGTSMLYPQMNKLKEHFQIKTVVSSDTTRGGNFARTNRVSHFSTDIQDVLDDPEIKLVVIATRHNQHAEQVTRCLLSGKHVFVEKPLALTWEELDNVVDTYNQLEVKPVFMVGFNRRFSPAISILKDILSKRRSPMMINYRLNGGYIPLDHWVQDGQGGGRNIGEACHMYDVFRCLCNAPVRSIHADAINPGSLPYMQNDNFCASITYQDGSLANLTYTALGPKEGLSKERIEVFCDNEAYVIEDFKELYQCNPKKILWQNSEPDKGHYEELNQIGTALSENTTDQLITFDEIIEASAVALHIEDRIQGRL